MAVSVTRVAAWPPPPFLLFARIVSAETSPWWLLTMYPCCADREFTEEGREGGGYRKRKKSFSFFMHFAKPQLGSWSSVFLLSHTELKAIYSKKEHVSFRFFFSFLMWWAPWRFLGRKKTEESTYLAQTGARAMFLVLYFRLRFFFPVLSPFFFFLSLMFVSFARLSTTNDKR